MLRLTAMEAGVATLTVRNLEDDVVKRLRIRAAENGRSAEAEHREILKAALLEHERRQETADRLDAFRNSITAVEVPSAADTLREVRRMRMKTLTGSDEGF